MAALGSLVVKLALDYAQYTSGLSKSEQDSVAFAKRVQDQVDQLKTRVATTVGSVAGLLAAGLSINAFKGLLEGVVASAAGLEDLATQAGTTVEALSGLSSVGKFSDMGADQIAAAMNKLTKNLTSVTEESAGTGKAIRAMGLDVQAFGALKPEEQMMTVAKSLATFEDGASKSAVAMALWGKEGAKMLPFLKDLADVGDLQAKVTTEQAAAAAAYDDNLTRITSSSEAWKTELVMGMIPALDNAAQAYLDVMNGTGGLRDEVRQLNTDGSIAEWTRNAIKGVTYVMDVFSGLKAVVKSVGSYWGALAATATETVSGLGAAAARATKRDFAGAASELSGIAGRVRTVWSSLGDDLGDIWGEQTLGSKLRARIDELATAGKAATEAKKQLDATGLGVSDKNGSAAIGKVDPTIKAYADLTASIREKIAAQGLELETGGKLTESEKLALDVKKLVEKGSITATQATSAEMQALMGLLSVMEAETAAEAKRVKQLDELTAARDREVTAAMGETASLQQQLKTQNESNQAIGLSATALAALEAARLSDAAAAKERMAAIVQEKEGNTTLADQYLEQASLLRDLAAARKGGARAREELDIWNSIESTAKNVWTSVTEQGQSAWKRIGQTLKASVLDLLWQITAKRWLISIGASLGVPGAAQAASAASGAGTGMLSSMGGSLLGGATFGSVGSYASTGFMNTLFGTGTAAGWGAGGAIGGANGLAMQLGAAAPWLLGGLAVLSLIKSLDKGKTYHSGGLGSYSAAGGSAVGDAVKGQGLDFGLSSRDYRAASEGAAVDMARAVVGLLDSTASTFGKEAGYYAATAFADDSSKSGAWGALMLRLGDRVLLDWGKGADKWPGREFADGEAGAKEYAAAVAKDVRDYLIAQTPDWADAMLSALGDTPTLETLSAVVGQINQAANALEGMGRASQAFAAMTDAATAALIKGLGGGASAASVLDGYYQAFYTEQERTALATARLTEQMAALGVAMPKDHVAFRALVDAAIASGKPELAAALINLSGAFNAVTSTAGTAADAARQAAAATTQALRAAIDREKAQWQTAADAASTLRDEVQGIFDVLADGISGLRADAWGTEGTAAVAQRYITDSIAAAMTTGVLPDAAGLADAIGAARTGISGGQYASDAERSYAALVLAGQLETLHAVAGDQLTEAERQYRAAQTQIEQLDKTLAYWQQQVDLSQGQIDEIKTVAEAVRDLQETLKPGSTGRGGAGGNGARGGVMLNTSASSMDAYRSLAEGPPTVYTRDANGNGGSFQDTANWAQVGGRWINISGQTMANQEDYWAARLQHAYDSPAADMASTWQQLTSGMFAGDASRLIAAARGAGLSENVIASYVHEFMPKLAVGTNYIPEDGPYYLHKGEAVQPAAYNPVLGNGGAMANTARLEAAFARFEARMASVEGAIREGNRHAATTADALDGARDGNALVFKQQESVFA